MDAQYTKNNLVALMTPWSLLKKNIYKMTYDGFETYANVLKT